MSEWAAVLGKNLMMEVVLRLQKALNMPSKRCLVCPINNKTMERLPCKMILVAGLIKRLKERSN